MSNEPIKWTDEAIITIALLHGMEAVQIGARVGKPMNWWGVFDRDSFGFVAGSGAETLAACARKYVRMHGLLPAEVLNN